MEQAGTVERGLAVLRATAAASGRRMRATDLVRDTGLARSTVDRVLATLAHLGYVRAEGRDVLLTPRLMEFGEAYLACGGLRDLLAPQAEELAGKLDESVSLAVPDGDGVRFIAQFTRRRAMSVAFRVGDLLPARRCAAGLALLDPDAPFAVDDQLVEPGLIAVAAPVRDPAGRPVCALSVVSHTSRHTVAGLRDHALPRLRQTVEAMEAALRRPAPPPRLAAAVDTSRSVKEELGAGYLQSLARGLAVLVSLGAARGGLTQADAAKVTGLPRATVRRAIQSLEQVGYVGPGEQARYVLLPRVLELGYAHLSGLSFAEVVQPHLADLVARIGESASMAVLSGQDVVYVARVPVARIMSVDITVGTRFPAHATSMGRVLLSEWPADRLAALPLRRLTRHTIITHDELAAAVRRAARDGHALVDQELEEGVRSLAVPVRDGGGTIVAALNVGVHAGRVSVEELHDRVLPALTATAAAIEADLALTRALP
ncbi:IclR family transcriptional regulator domain-containing protein [Sinosporangium siamense]|uniref:Transcriptional regulator n=1 Tax=Sinosporangium siamense TaxID=1367973 RepID=A0A919RQD8_9ACTN|nr:IclR family transcriptional regulator C-terminal domain-containing protein [Sinosporangium siamense]GII96749.1 transcriptional regulator [Sinosporangium siamense]